MELRGMEHVIQVKNVQRKREQPVAIVLKGGSTITENCTYIRNPSFPTAYADTTALSYTVEKCAEEVCDVRLDFESFTILGPSVTTEVGGGACPDTFIVTGTSGVTTSTICGINTGHHMYVNMGSESTDTAKIDFTFTGTANTRIWEIQVSQIPCYATYRPPQNCLQYFTGIAGRVKTFNFDNKDVMAHLGNQQYNVCIRQEDGYCCVQYQVCHDETNAFSLYDGVIAGQSRINTMCSQDYLSITGGAAQCHDATESNRFCGKSLNPLDANANSVPICDCSTPFEIGVKTDSTIDTPQTVGRGACVDFRLLPCRAT